MCSATAFTPAKFMLPLLIDAFDQFSLCSCIGGIYEGDHGLLDLAELGDGLIGTRDQQGGRKNGSK